MNRQGCPGAYCIAADCRRRLTCRDELERRWRRPAVNRDVSMSLAKSSNKRRGVRVGVTSKRLIRRHVHGQRTERRVITGNRNGGTVVAWLAVPQRKLRVCVRTGNDNDRTFGSKRHPPRAQCGGSSQQMCDGFSGTHRVRQQGEQESPPCARTSGECMHAPAGVWIDQFEAV